MDEHVTAEHEVGTREAVTSDVGPDEAAPGAFVAARNLGQQLWHHFHADVAP